MTEDEIADLLTRPGSTRNERQEIYFVQGVTTGLVKIGSANDAAKRLRELALSNADRLKLLGVMLCWRKGALETDLHERFRAHRSHGEWFRPHPEMLHWIRYNVLCHEPRERALQAVLDDPNWRRGRPRKNNGRTESVKGLPKRVSAGHSKGQKNP